MGLSIEAALDGTRKWSAGARLEEDDEGFEQDQQGRYSRTEEERMIEQNNAALASLRRIMPLGV